MRAVAVDLSGDGALAGGLVSGLVLWLAKMLIGRTLADVTAEMARLRNEVSRLNQSVAYIKGRLAIDDTGPPAP